MFQGVSEVELVKLMQLARVVEDINHVHAKELGLSEYEMFQLDNMEEGIELPF